MNKTAKKFHWSHVAVIFGLLFINHVQAQIIGSGYPPPGGVTNSGSGSAGTTGKTSYYTNFNLADYSSLYWTFSSIANPYATPYQGNDNSTMLFSNFDSSTGIATWTSTENTTWDTGSGGVINVPTELQLQFQPYTGTSQGFLASGFLTPTTAGAAGISGLASGQSVLNVTGNFQIFYQLVAEGSGGGQGLTTYYNNSDRAAGSLSTGTTGSFYWTAAVPEPSTWAMLWGGLGILALAHRRLRRS